MIHFNIYVWVFSLTLPHCDCVRKFEGKMLTRIDFVCFVDFPGLIMTKRQVFGFLPCKTMYSVNTQNVTNHNYQVRRNKHSGTRHVFYTLEKIFIGWIAEQIFYISSHSLSSFVLSFYLTFLLFRLSDLVSGTRSFQQPRNGLMSIGFSPQPVSIPRGNSFANGRIFCKKKIKTWKVGSLSPPASGDLVASQVWYSLPHPNPDSTFRFDWSKLFKTDKLNWLVQSNPNMVKWSTMIYLVIY